MELVKAAGPATKIGRMLHVWANGDGRVLLFVLAVGATAITVDELSVLFVTNRSQKVIAV